MPQFAQIAVEVGFDGVEGISAKVLFMLMCAAPGPGGINNFRR